MDTYINAEEINDRAKLMTHRIVARLLVSDPAIIDRAKVRLRELKEDGRTTHAFGEWAEMLERPLPEIRRIITSRSEDMTRLRISSPLGLAAGIFVNDEPLRRRIRKLAKRGLELRAAREPAETTQPRM